MWKKSCLRLAFFASSSSSGGQTSSTQNAKYQHTGIQNLQNPPEKNAVPTGQSEGLNPTPHHPGHKFPLMIQRLRAVHKNGNLPMHHVRCGYDSTSRICPYGRNCIYAHSEQSWTPNLTQDLDWLVEDYTVWLKSLPRKQPIQHEGDIPVQKSGY